VVRGLNLKIQPCVEDFFTYFLLATISSTTFFFACFTSHLHVIKSYFLNIICFLIIFQIILSWSQTQTALIDKILTSFNMVDCNPVSTPIEAGLILSHQSNTVLTRQEEIELLNLPYR
jgi:hypothetical protein